MPGLFEAGGRRVQTEIRNLPLFRPGTGQFLQLRPGLQKNSCRRVWCGGGLSPSGGRETSQTDRQTGLPGFDDSGLRIEKPCAKNVGTGRLQAAPLRAGHRRKRTGGLRQLPGSQKTGSVVRSSAMLIRRIFNRGIPLPPTDAGVRESGRTR